MRYIIPQSAIHHGGQCCALARRVLLGCLLLAGVLVAATPCVSAQSSGATLAGQAAQTTQTEAQDAVRQGPVTIHPEGSEAAAATPFLRIDETLAYFTVASLPAPERLAEAWGVPAGRALALAANQRRPRSFAAAPPQPSHVVGEAWFAMPAPAGETLLFLWDAAGYHGPAMWFAVRREPSIESATRSRLHAFSSQVDPQNPDAWYLIGEGKSSYDQWQVGGANVEIEVMDLSGDAQDPQSQPWALYRFRLLGEGEATPAAPVAPRP